MTSSLERVKRLMTASNEWVIVDMNGPEMNLPKIGYLKASFFLFSWMLAYWIIYDDYVSFN